MMCSGRLKNDSLCLRLQCESKFCVASRCNGQEFDIQRPDLITLLALSISIKIYLHITIISKSISLAETSLVHVSENAPELFLFFLSDCTVRCCFL